MTDKEVLVLMARVLGGHIDTGEGANEFIHTGPAGNRTALEGPERKLTRRVNQIGNLIDLLNTGVEGFNTRFSLVVGAEKGADEEAFIKIGSNLIRAVLKLQEDGGSGGGFSPEERDLMNDILGEPVTKGYFFDLINGEVL